MATHVNVAALRAAAGVLEGRAAAAEQAASELARQLHFRWESEFSRGFRAANEARCRRLRELAARLRSLAVRLRHMAAQLEAELARLEALERAVRQAIEDIVASGGVRPPLPVSGSPEWELLSRTLPPTGAW